MTKKEMIEELEKINCLNSCELLCYSKAQHTKKSEIGMEVSNILFEAVEKRRAIINSNVSEKLECKNQGMIKKFLRGLK